jgi:hypothetical protein
MKIAPCLAICLAIFLASIGSAVAAPSAVSTEQAAILIGQTQCGFARHGYQKWAAVSVGENWEVHGLVPRRFTAMGEGVTVPKSGAVPFDCHFLSPPGVPADSFNAFVGSQPDRATKP